MSAFGDALKARAKEAGHETVQSTPTSPDVEKAETKSAFAAALKANKSAPPAAVSQAPELIARELGPIPRWSFSGLKTFENCPKSAENRYVHKMYGEQGEAAARGSKIHDECEEYVRGLRDELPSDRKTKMAGLQGDFDQLRELFPTGVVFCEQDWYFDRDWMPCEKDERWGVAKLDAFVMEGNSCRIIDYKTGRKFGNEMKHSDQGLCYAITAFHKYPELDFFQVEFWYLDQNEKMVRAFTRSQLGILIKRYERRALLFTTATEFPAKPNANACMFCDYTANTSKQGVAWGDGSCEYDFYGGSDY